MIAAVIHAPGDLRLDDVSAPEPGPRDVRVRLEGCGVCGSHKPLWEGREWFKYPCDPGSPGHEGWGVVDAVGAEVTRIRSGQRVTALSYRAFAEYDLATEDAVVPLPPALDGVPFPGEALGCAMNVLRRTAIAPGQHVAVVGVGFLGALLVQLAAGAGAHVAAVSRRAFARDVARACGAEAVFDLAHADTAGALREWSGGDGCERVIEAAGVQETLDLATAVTAERGVLVIAGYHQDGMRQVDLQLWNWRGLDVINAHERDPRAYVAGMRDAIDAVAAGRLDPAPLYTHRFPLADLGHALDAMRDRPGEFLKSLVYA
jgi:threonine dehydrogenase-like Zn-dependent dehydrogenase